MQEAKEHLGRRPVLVLVSVLLLARSEPKALPCLTPPEPDTMDRVCARGSVCVCVWCVWCVYLRRTRTRTTHTVRALEVLGWVKGCHGKMGDVVDGCINGR